MRVALAIFLSCAALALANPLWFGSSSSSGGGGGGGGGGFTCGTTCWPDATCSNGGSCSATSTTVTITGSGTFKFHSDFGHSMQYSDNGGAFTGISQDGTLSWTSGHTLALKIQTLTSGLDEDTITVSNNSGGATVGTFFGQNTHP
jgi:hypothetical protein